MLETLVPRLTLTWAPTAWRPSPSFGLHEPDTHVSLNAQVMKFLLLYQSNAVTSSCSKISASHATRSRHDNDAHELEWELGNFSAQFENCPCGCHPWSVTPKNGTNGQERRLQEYVASEERWQVAVRKRCVSSVTANVDELRSALLKHDSLLSLVPSHCFSCRRSAHAAYYGQATS